MELSPDPPHPYLRIENGYELQLEVPKKPKLFKVYLYKEYFDDEKLEMVIRRSPTSFIHLHGDKVEQITLDEKENWPKYDDWEAVKNT